MGKEVLGLEKELGGKIYRMNLSTEEIKIKFQELNNDYGKAFWEKSQKRDAEQRKAAHKYRDYRITI
jgi:hypothetical protein